MTYPLNHYQKDAIAFAKHDLSHRDALINWTFGFAEAGEFQSLVLTYIESGCNPTSIDSTEVCKELGDLMWYCAMLSHQLDWTFNAVAALTSINHRDRGLEWHAIALGVAVSKVQEPLKKHLFQGHGYDANEIAVRISSVVHIVWETANYFGLTLEEVCRANIAKLKARYPNGFDPAISQALYK